MNRYYQIARYPFQLHIEGAEAALIAALEAALDVILAAFRRSGDAPRMTSSPVPLMIETAVGYIECRAGDSFHQFNIHLNSVSSSIPLVQLVDALEPEIVNQAIRESQGFLWVHGACLHRDNRTILLVAESGTGKTTLSLGLLHHGFRLLTDDVILIDPVVWSIQPLLRCPKVRLPAPDLLRQVGFDLERQVQTFERYVLLPEHFLQPVPIPASVDQVYLLTRSPDLPSGMQELDLTSGILALLPRSNLIGIDPDLSFAHALFSRTRFKTLNLSHFPHDLATIASLD